VGDLDAPCSFSILTGRPPERRQEFLDVESVDVVELQPGETMIRTKQLRGSPIARHLDQENPMAVDQLMPALMGTDEMELTVADPSVRQTSRPVWFVQEGERLYLLPVRGSDSYWYRIVLKSRTVSLAVGGMRRSARATPITDPAKVWEVVEKFRARYGADQVQTYYSKLDVAVEVSLV
jgi:hypothetical protein